MRMRDYASVEISRVERKLRIYREEFTAVALEQAHVYEYPGFIGGDQMHRAGYRPYTAAKFNYYRHM